MPASLSPILIDNTPVNPFDIVEITNIETSRRYGKHEAFFLVALRGQEEELAVYMLDYPPKAPRLQRARRLARLLRHNWLWYKLKGLFTKRYSSKRLRRYIQFAAEEQRLQKEREEAIADLMKQMVESLTIERNRIVASLVEAYQALHSEERDCALAALPLLLATELRDLMAFNNRHLRLAHG